MNAHSLAATHGRHDLPALDRYGLRLDPARALSRDYQRRRPGAPAARHQRGPAHTYGRNSNAVALSCACMGGQPDPWTLPPTPAQLESLCAETAAIARSWGWSAEDITIQRVMTHAKAASNKDGRLMHDNYGPVVWGGTGERWDLLQLEKNGPL